MRNMEKRREQARRSYYKNRKMRIAYKRRFYEENRQYWRDWAQKRVNSAIAYVRKQKDNPCTDCNEKYPFYVMQFDHRPGEEKMFEVSTIAKANAPLGMIQEEIEKCDLVCANCHAERTHSRHREAGLEAN